MSNPGARSSFSFLVNLLLDIAIRFLDAFAVALLLCLLPDRFRLPLCSLDDLLRLIPAVLQFFSALVGQVFQVESGDTIAGDGFWVAMVLQYCCHLFVFPVSGSRGCLNLA